MCRPVEPKPPNWTAIKKVVGLPTFVVGKHPADSKIDTGGEVVTAPTLAKAKARHEQVPSRDNPGPSALAQKDNKVAPRVGRYLAGGDPPPPQAFFDESLRTLASTGDGGPEDAPEEPTSGSHRLVSLDPGEETTLRYTRSLRWSS
ncbi:hypothetical protein B296_00042867 [Ensete ventricosum]|uniref:Uncharacterized protein n=1 Tax=Ensete ventricosum TaxID=4639 RepID=A0A426WZN6_ENSVE|nr:hypothetical protein B296_00042867 [Ensete ventricosum]